MGVGGGTQHEEGDIALECCPERPCCKKTPLGDRQTPEEAEGCWLINKPPVAKARDSQRPPEILSHGIQGD